jgi:photolyase PhrII
MSAVDQFLRSLPPALDERTRRIGRRDTFAAGNFVLYWMRTAIRVDENPALDVAIEAANHLELPLLVYQGLTERYPYASDRHHTFVLQGARDVQAAFEARQISYVLHVERSGHRGPHLKTLGNLAALVVTEDMPSEPLRSWTVSLGRGIPSALLAVDTACLVPMRLVGRAYDRAFAYRDATKKLYEERLSRGANASELRKSARFSGDLPFESVDLGDASLDELVAECQIDHSVGSVPDTRGGSEAGYRRWLAFKNDSLSTYHRRRNNPLVDGVSRMSAYLHYGMVSPARIARECAAEHNPGAEKYLDELLIWRELAYAFCFYRPDHCRISSIPSWALKTLSEHESEVRPTLLTWESMARGLTGDSIWDSAQKSLLVHGELHNNVRMTWGKAILKWTPDAMSALARMVDLNHRYALDGRDPASYGGILWCLGQFDRPFTPEQPIFGSVRTRPTDWHAKRLDPVAYRRRVSRSRSDPMPRVAVIGAGISGLVCARTLADHGLDVRLFEKSRGLGGRMSTRRVDQNLSFDHGAQYFTARDKRFKTHVRSWVQEGIVHAWNGRIVVLERGEVKETKRSGTRYVAGNGMNSIGKHLGSNLQIDLNTRVAPPRRVQSRWCLSEADGDALGQFDVVVAAVPSLQAAELLVETPDLADLARGTRMNGCWALMMAFDRSLDLPFDGAFVDQSPLSWIARNNSKSVDGTGVGPEGECETWVVHTTPTWTDNHLDDDADEIQAFLLGEFWKVTGRASRNPRFCSIHRWRYAIPKQPLASECLFEKQQGIGACGDWCGGPRVEGAFLSGMAMAGRILGHWNSAPGPEVHQDRQLNLF